MGRARTGSSTRSRSSSFSRGPSRHLREHGRETDGQWSQALCELHRGMARRDGPNGVRAAGCGAALHRSSGGSRSRPALGSRDSTHADRGASCARNLSAGANQAKSAMRRTSGSRPFGADWTSWELSGPRILPGVPRSSQRAAGPWRASGHAGDPELRTAAAPRPARSCHRYRSTQGWSGSRFRRGQRGDTC